MTKSKIARVSKEFDQYIEELSKQLNIPKVALTQKLAQMRPIRIEKPFGHSIDQIFINAGILPKQERKVIKFKKRRIIK